MKGATLNERLGAEDLADRFPQGFGAIPYLIFKIGSRPIQNRHEIIANNLHIACRQMANALFIIFYVLVIIGLMSFDIIMNRNAFNN